MTSPPIAITAGPHEVAFTWGERSARRAERLGTGSARLAGSAQPVRMPRLETASHRGSVQRDRRQRDAERERCSCAAARRPPRSPRAPRRICRRSRSARSAVPSTPRTSRRRSRSIATRAPKAAISIAGIRAGVARMLVSPWFLFRVEADSPDVPAGSHASHQRLRARVAAVVLPLVEHPRRRAARRSPIEGQLARRRACSKRKCGA